MSFNRARINIDLVQPTKYNILPNRTAKKPPPKPWPLPKFKPLHINNFDDYGMLNLLPDIDLHNPFNLFSLFFINDIIDKLVEWMNKHIELYLLDKDKENPRL